MKTCLLLLLIWLTPAVAAATPKLAVVSYWGQRVENFDHIPDHTVALINPSSGILVEDSVATPVDNIGVYKDVFRRAKSTIFASMAMCRLAISVTTAIRTASARPGNGSSRR